MTQSFTFEKVADGQEFSFDKLPANMKIETLNFGLGWDPAKVGKDVDLDASIIQLDEQGEELDIVYFSHKDSKDGAIHHSGDDLTGGNSEKGDDEVISVDITKLDPKTKSLIATITSYSGQTFDHVRNAYCRVVNTTSGEIELCRVELTKEGSHTAVIAAKLYQDAGEWKFLAVNKIAEGKTVGDLRSIAKTV